MFAHTVRTLYRPLLWLVTITLTGALLAAPTSATTPATGGFVENIGQLDEQVIFSTSTSGMAVFLTEDGLVIDAFDPRAMEETEPVPSDGTGTSSVLSNPRSSGRQGHVMRIRFQGARAIPLPTEGAMLPGILNFFEGTDPASWHTGARRFAEVAYREVWPGIDLVLRIAPEGIWYDAILDPDADPTQIRFEYEGPDHVSDLDGAVRLETPVGALTHRLPVPGETSGGIWRGEVGASNRFGEGCPGDTIDWITFLGGAGTDWGTAIAADAQGQSVVTGVTISADFPTTAGAYSDSATGEWDVFVTKLDASGSALVWSTYIGGSASEAPTSVNVDAIGNVVIAGATRSADFPTTPGAYDQMPSLPPDDAEGFVTKLSADGAALLWSTYLGMDLDDRVTAAVLDSDDNVVICGETFSSDFPTTSGAFRTEHPGGAVNDGFVTKLSSGGDALIWSTLLGADDEDDAVHAIDLDPSGNPVVGGTTKSTAFPTTAGAYQETHSGGPPGGFTEGFLTKLSADATSLIWSTYIGGQNGEQLMHLQIDPSSGDVFTTLRTASADFPTTPGAFDRIRSGSRDGAVARLSADGDALIWGTYLGGSNEDNPAGIAILPFGDVVVVGDTKSNDFPVTENAFDSTYNGDPADGFIAFLTLDGSSLLWSTYVGGSGPVDDGFGGDAFYASPVFAYGDAADATVLVTGWSGSPDYPTCPSGVWDTTFEGDSDAVTLAMVYSSVDVPQVLPGIGRRLMLASSPNPFRNGTAITYELPTAGPARVTVHDVAGRLVRELQSVERMSAGSHRLIWDGTDNKGSSVVPGVYFVRLETRDRWSSGRIVRVR